ncbi:MAG: hypothetical protein R2710_13235 [Acidimicrobiales bacterium]
MNSPPPSWLRRKRSPRLSAASTTRSWSNCGAGCRRNNSEFQDFVFSRECDGRSQLYAETTGRFAVDGS